MPFDASQTPRAFRRKSLAASLLAAFALSANAGASQQPTPVWTFEQAEAWYPLRPVVEIPRIPRNAFSAATEELNSFTDAHAGKPLLTCDETGLRNAIANAASGDVLDLTACSEITLTTGQINVLVDDLTLQGPGLDLLSIKGGASTNHFNRIFRHTGIGTLLISGITLTDAHYVGAVPNGGCLYSNGSISLVNTVVTGCMAEAAVNSGSYALGGGIYARGDVWINGGAVIGNIAVSNENAAYGGGIFGRGKLSTKYATVANNLALAPSADYSVGGGIAILGSGDVSIHASTLFGNAAELGGGAYLETTGTAQVVDSTISQNVASFYVGGLMFVGATGTLNNSTVTANGAGYANDGVGVYASQTLSATSSIIANNFDATGNVLDVSAPMISGSEDLIVSATAPLPDGTITACPRLTPLQDNGGPTLTHKLIAGSPGIDVGNALGLSFDQRGLQRTFGAFADIGAVEWQGELDDSLFKSAFELRCD